MQRAQSSAASISSMRARIGWHTSLFAKQTVMQQGNTGKCPYRGRGTEGPGAHQVTGHAVAGAERDDANGRPWLQIQVTATSIPSSDSCHKESVLLHLGIVWEIEPEKVMG